MKYMSEITKEFYNSEKECLEAEKIFQEKQEKAIIEKKKKDAERSARAKEVEDAYIAYKKLLNQFIKDYGSYHQTIKDNDSWSILDVMFGGWPF